MKKELQQLRSQLWHRERTPNLKSRSDRRKEDDQELRERKMKVMKEDEPISDPWDGCPDTFIFSRII